jgi:formyl-CoA transferase
LAEAPYNVYPTTDGWIAIICVGEVHWKSLARTMGCPELADDPRFAALKQRVAAMDEVDTLVSEWTRGRSKQEAFETLMAHQVPCAPVRDLDEVMNDPNMHARGSLLWQNHPDLGRIVVQHSPLRFAGAPLMPLEPSRKLGADTRQVVGERLGWDDERLDRLEGLTTKAQQ